MKHIYGWAIIGTGMIANAVAKELSSHKDIKIVSVWNRTYKKAVKFTNTFKCKAYETLEDAINDPAVDAVYIALNHHVHYDYLKRCIMCHKPILCEKPFTLNELEAKEVFELANKENTYVAEAMWTWYNKPALKVKEWLDSKVLGKITKVDIVYSNPILYLYRMKRLVDINLGGGALIDSGVYPITYAYKLFGYPNKIICDCKKGLKHGVDEGENITFIYDNLEVNIVCTLTGKLDEYVKIVGENGEVFVPSFHSGNKAILKVGDKVTNFVSNNKGYYAEFINTNKDVESGKKESSFVSQEDTLAVMRIMDECRRQMGLVYPMEKK